MTQLWIGWLLLAAQAAATAAPTTPPASPPAPASAEPPDASLEAQFADTLAQDAASDAGPTTATPPVGSSPSLFNPAMIVIATLTGGLWHKDVAPAFSAGDDADAPGFTVQELELGFTADVDPYFQMMLFLTIPRLEGVEVEEAIVQTTSLPASLLLRAGVFRSSFGRNNEQHLHLQNFARRPQTTRLLGADGLRAPGVQLSWLVPLPYYASLFAETFSLDRLHPSLVAGVEQFFALSDTWSLLVGVSGAYLQRPADLAVSFDPAREYLAGADVYAKWKPTNVTDTYAWIAVTAEAVASRPKDAREWSVASYLEVTAQVARRFRLAARVDLTGLGNHATVERELVAGASIAFLPTEFSRVRLTFEHDDLFDRPEARNERVFLQLETSIGSHQAHPF